MAYNNKRCLYVWDSRCILFSKSIYVHNYITFAEWKHCEEINFFLSCFNFWPRRTIWRLSFADEWVWLSNITKLWWWSAPKSWKPSQEIFWWNNVFGRKSCRLLVWKSKENWRVVDGSKRCGVHRKTCVVGIDPRKKIFDNKLVNCIFNISTRTIFILSELKDHS